MTAPSIILERRRPDLAAARPGEVRRTRAQLVVAAVLALTGLTVTVVHAALDAFASAGSSLRPAGIRTIDPYRGLGAWIDVHDYAPSYQRAGARPPVAPESVAQLATTGVRTLFLQTSGSGPRSPGDLVDRDLVARFLREAHAAGLAVVGWYLPAYADVEADLRRLRAVAEFDVDGERFDGIAVDIEAGRGVPDAPERTKRLLDLSARLRAILGDRPVGAIVPPAILLEEVTPSYWPGFPWRELARHYDVWLPMSYWTVRSRDSGLRDAFVLTVRSVERQRDLLGRDVPIHVIGGVADQFAPGDLERFLAAIRHSAPIGASVYDHRATDEQTRRLLERELQDARWGAEGLVE